MDVARGKKFKPVGTYSMFTCLFWVGNGKRIRFWHEVCCGDHSLKDSFLELCFIAVEKDA